MRVIIGILGVLGFLIMKRKKREQDNRYFPVESSSEIVAGHPIVGVS